LLEKNAPDMIRAATRARSHAERTDIKRGAFEGKPSVKYIRKSSEYDVKTTLRGASPYFTL
jgi:hypothetical protein